MRGKIFSSIKKPITILFLILLFFSIGIFATHFKYHVSFDAIIQTYGTLLGAFLGAWLAGKYAVDSVKSQIEFSKKENKKNEIERFLKDYYVLSEYLHLCKRGTEKIIENIEGKQSIIINGKDIFDIYLDNLKRDLSPLECFNYRNIPLKNHKDLLSVIREIKLFYFECISRRDVKNLNEMKANIEKLIEIIDSFAIEQEIEFNQQNQ